MHKVEAGETSLETLKGRGFVTCVSPHRVCERTTGQFGCKEG
jgi:hypothetical protein